MANAFRKAANFLGLVDDLENDPSNPEVAQSEPRFNRPVRTAPITEASAPSYLRSASTRSTTPVPTAQGSNVGLFVGLVVSIAVIVGDTGLVCVLCSRSHSSRDSDPT